MHVHLPALCAYADTNTYGYYDAEAICEAQISPYSATASLVNKVAASNPYEGCQGVSLVDGCNIGVAGG